MEREEVKDRREEKRNRQGRERGSLGGGGGGEEEGRGGDRKEGEEGSSQNVYTIFGSSFPRVSQHTCPNFTPT